MVQAKMKIAYTFCISFLAIHVTADEKYSRSSNRGLKGRLSSELTDPQPDSERLLGVIPTLLKKFIDVKKKFDVYDGILGDVLFGLAPSDVPSLTPSDAPTTVPSDAPSISPMQAPSSAPFSWNEVLGSDSYDFETCASDPEPIDFQKSTELTVLYGYKLELQPNVRVWNATDQIEMLLQKHLVEQVCNTFTDTLGVTSSPSDGPGGKFFWIFWSSFCQLVSKTTANDTDTHLFCIITTGTRSFSI
jgi:hypothetical protein